jgi:predicted nucleotide-binding protein (sugar kinase/HSP70/actin superfamily)
MIKKAKLLDHQENLINGLIDEIVKGNKVFETETKASGSPFDVSGIVKDIAEKQRGVNENNALRVYWKGIIKEQVKADIKKLNKALDKIGFMVESYAERSKRKYNRLPDPINYGENTLIISHKTLRYNSGSSYSPNLTEYSVEVEYCVTHDNSKRKDLDTPCGFLLRTNGFDESGYQRTNTSDYIKKNTIEEIFTSMQGWIKKYYEQATLVH